MNTLTAPYLKMPAGLLGRLQRMGPAVDNTSTRCQGSVVETNALSLSLWGSRRRAILE